MSRGILPKGVLLLFFAVCVFAPSYGGDFYRDTVLVKDRKGTKIVLSHRYVIPETINIVSLEKGVYINCDSITVDAMNGVIYGLKSDKVPVRVVVSYRYIAVDFDIKDVMVESFPAELYSGFRGKRGGTQGKKEIYASENIISSGSIFRKVSFGTNSGVSLSSGLNLRISGKITDDIVVSGVLSDQSIPIEPEGTTQSLNEIDRVYIEARMPHEKIVIGDFNYRLDEGRLCRYNRKLQGVYLRSERSGIELELSGAVSRGEYFTNYFLGEDGNQGPYQLYGKNGESSIVVLAGTERVWLNGELLERGENADYVIDYSTGQITFTSKRVITSNSRITVDFQYSDFSYVRNVVSMSLKKAIGDRFIFSFSSIREKDDRNSGLGLEPAEAEKKFLSQVGDASEGRVYVSTITPDSMGSYIVVDSVLVYVGEGKGTHTAVFYNVGKDGCYRKVYDGNMVYFEYVEKGDPSISNAIKDQAVYLPARPLKLPVKEGLYHIGMEYHSSENFNVSGEVAVSSFDKNVFSEIGDGDNRGVAGRLFALYKVKLGSSGNLKLWGKYRGEDKKFHSPFREKEVEFKRKWGLPSDTTRRERFFESGIEYSSRSSVVLGFEGGKFSDIGIESDRYKFRGEFSKGFLEKARVFYEVSHPGLADSSGEWWKRGGNFVCEVFGKNLQVSYYSEKSEGLVYRQDFVFDERSVKIGSKGERKILWSVELHDRFDRRKKGNRWQKDSYEYYLKFNGRLGGYRRVFSDFNVYYLRKEFFSSGTPGLEGLAGKWLFRYRGIQKPFRFSSSMEFGRKRMVKRELRYFKVPMGQGDFIYDSTYAEFVPRKGGNYVLKVMPSNQTEPVSEVKIGFNLRVGGGVISQKSFAKRLRFLSSLRLDRKGRSSRQGNFISCEELVYFQLYSRNELVFYPGRGRDEIQLRYLIKDNRGEMDVRGYERRTNRNLSVNLRVGLAKSMKGEFGLTRETIERGSVYNTFLNRGGKLYKFKSKLSYLLSNGDKMMVNTEFSAGNLSYPERIVSRVSNLKGEYEKKIGKRGMVRAFVKYIKVVSDKGRKSIPWEISGGRMPGITVGWGGSVIYALRGTVNIRLNYEGWREPIFGLYHIGGVEAGVVF